MKDAATNERDFRKFLLVAQFEAKAIGARLASARHESGLTQEQLAEMASFSKRSLQDYEAGETIPYRHMREISGLLGRDVEWFLHGERPQATEDELASIADRLRSLEGQVADSVALMRRALELLGDQPANEGHQVPQRANG